MKKDANTGVALQAAISSVADLYVGALNQGLSPSNLPPFMLWGPPGVGKSQGVRQIALDVGKRTGRKAVVTDVRLMLFNPVDLRGIPVANAERTLAVWLKPEVFDMDADDGIVNVLFLDEISAAPPSVQATAYQITLDRRIGEHRLPDNCIVIAAGNRVTDRSVAYKMPKALANRLCHIDVRADHRTWKAWAVRSGIDPRILGFLEFQPDRLMRFDTATDDHAFATPRSWEMLSRVLDCLTGDDSGLFLLTSGCVGEGVATEFLTWIDVYDSLPDIAAIFDGKDVEVPKSTDALYALVSSMVAYARDNLDDEWRIERSIAYGTRLPVDYTVVLFRDYQSISEQSKRLLMRSEALNDWSIAHGRFFNDI
ncbi:MAG: MoxR family ATPase [Coriobacteriales bacterium]|jgi:hypothetical protein|nr:MoxR family ATPase [Coriobacteriales bacterium]